MDVTPLLDQVSRELAILREARRRFSGKLAPDFRLFRYLRADETGLSRCIADLLDPEGPHGQGGLFMDQFKFALGLPQWVRADRLDQIRLEYPTLAGRRIDICLKFKGGQLLGIENKPTAVDQDRQLSDYGSSLQSQAQPQDWLLLYVSNAEPGEASLLPEDRLNWANANFRHIRFDNEIESWLHACAEKAEAPIVRLFVEQVLTHVREAINGERDMNESDQVADIIRSNGANIESALSVASAWPKVQRELLKKLKTQLDEIFESSSEPIFPKLECDPSILDAKKSSGLKIHFWQDQDLVLKFEFDQANYGNLLWGLFRQTDRDISVPEIEKIKTLMQGQFGTGRSNQWWAWYAWGSDSEFTENLYNWSNSPAPWIGIKNGKMANHLFGLAKKVREIFEGTEENQRLLGPRNGRGKIDSV